MSTDRNTTAGFSQFNLDKFNATDRSTLVDLARVAENAERYEDMCKWMRAIVENDSSALSVEERNLLSVAYKNVIGARRASWRTLNMEDSDPNIETYKGQIESELETICKEVLALLSDKLIPSASGDNEAEVFYRKMAGDYYRYLAEFVEGKGYDENARENYEAALKTAEGSLAPTHPIRLGLALNFSVCYYEILKDQTKACDLAKSAFDDAIAKLDQLDEASYKDSTLIMQLLRDNLTLWTSEQPDAEE